VFERRVITIFSLVAGDITVYRMVPVMIIMSPPVGKGQ